MTKKLNCFKCAKFLSFRRSSEGRKKAIQEICERAKSPDLTLPQVKQNDDVYILCSYITDRAKVRPAGRVQPSGLQLIFYHFEMIVQQ